MSNYAIYFSPTGNTKKSVCAIAQGLGQAIKKCDITTPAGRKRIPQIQKDDVIVFGVPVYGGRIPKLVIPFIESLDGAGATAVVVNTYGVREYDDALLELSDLLQARSFVVTGAAAIIGEHSFSNKVGTGRPNETDLKQAKEFGEKIAIKIKTVKTQTVKTQTDQDQQSLSLEAVPDESIAIRGNRPYKPYGKATPVTKLVTTDACSRCGICSNLCPTGAISTTDQKEIDLNKCIKCHTCIRNCPVMAKHFDDEGVTNVKQFLESKLAGVYKDNQFFL